MLVSRRTPAPQRPRVAGEEILLGKSTRLARLVAVRGRWKIEDWPEDALRVLLAQAYGPSEAALPSLIKAVHDATALLPRSLFQAANALQGLPEPLADADQRLIQAERLLKAGADPRGLATAMRREGLNLRPAPTWTEHLALCDKGVVLGHGTVIVGLADHADGGTGLAVEGNETQILALLSVASGRLAPPDALAKLASASRSLAKGNAAQAAIALCHIGQPPLEDSDLATSLEQGAWALSKGTKASELLEMSRLLPYGVTGDDWLKSLGKPFARGAGSSFDESKHPREGEGAHYPGRFVSTNGGETGDQEKPESKEKINWSFIEKEEGNKLTAYVLKNESGKPDETSGVTVGMGVDLGGEDKKGLGDAGIPPSIIEKLAPYLNKTGSEAEDYLKDHPLTLTGEEVDTLNRCVMAQKTKEVIQNYDQAVEGANRSRDPGSGLKSFGELKESEQTVILSLGYNMGPGFAANAQREAAREDPTGTWKNRRELWRNLVTQAFEAAADNLQYAARHEKAKTLAGRRLRERSYLLTGVAPANK